MKILTVVCDLGKGGVARTACMFAAGYRRLGVDSRVLATTEGGPREADLKAHDVPCLHGLNEESLQTILSWNPDAVHVHSHGFSDQEMKHLETIFSGRVVVEQNIFSRRYPWTARMDYSFQMSYWCLWRFCNNAPDAADKAVLVPNSADPSAFRKASDADVAAFREQHGIPRNALVIGRIGQLHFTKWSPVLIDAFNRLARKYKSLHLVLVNPSIHVRKQAADSPFTKQIVLIDKIIGDAALSIAYSAMDVFALAADQGESFGNVLVEAMLCETPAVALSTPWQDNSQCEVVGHNKGGLIALTPKGFRKAIDTLLRDPLLRTTLGKTGRKRVAQKYEYIRTAQHSLDIIQGKSAPIDPATLDGQILEIYQDAFERASPLTLLFIRKRLLRLTRYTTHYWPMRQLPAELLKTALKRFRKS